MSSSWVPAAKRQRKFVFVGYAADLRAENNACRRLVEILTETNDQDYQPRSVATLRETGHEDGNSPIAAKLGIKNLGSHMLRHWNSTTLDEDGFSTKVRQGRLGRPTAILNLE